LLAMSAASPLMGDVATGMRKAGDQAAADRVGGECHYDRDFVRCLLGSADRRFAANHQDIDRQVHELGCQRREPIKMTVGIAVFHLEMAFFDITEVTHPEQKLTAQVRFYRVRRRSWFEITQLKDFRLLRARCERPSDCRATNPFDELASPHSITSSALACSDWGTVRFRALAVFMLMTS